MEFKQELIKVYEEYLDFQRKNNLIDGPVTFASFMLWLLVQESSQRNKS